MFQPILIATGGTRLEELDRTDRERPARLARIPVLFVPLPRRDPSARGSHPLAG